MVMPRKPLEHGTITGYSKGCRCDDCRATAAEYQRRRRRGQGVSDIRGRKPTYGVAAILCGRCRLPIEGCEGDMVDWMHTATRRERCADMGLATPETVEQFDARVKGRSAAQKRARRECA